MTSSNCFKCFICLVFNSTHTQNFLCVCLASLIPLHYYFPVWAQKGLRLRGPLQQKRLCAGSIGGLGLCGVWAPGRSPRHLSARPGACLRGGALTVLIWGVLLGRQLIVENVNEALDGSGD